MEDRTSRKQRTPVQERSQRMHRFAGTLLAAVDDATAGGIEGVSVGCLSAAEAAETVLDLGEVIARLQGLRLALLARADRVDAVASAPGPTAVDTAGWLAHAALLHGRTARQQVVLATTLTQTHTATASALLAGDVDTDQAQVIVSALDRLPDWVSSEDRARAEKHLLGEALRLDAVRLRRLARHLLEVIDPEGAEAEEARRLQAEEDHAADHTRLSLYDDGHGLTQIWGQLPTRHAAVLRKALHAWANPQRPDNIARTRQVTDPDTGETRALTRHTADVLGEAFCQLVEHLDPRRMPSSGGLNASIIVTMPLTTLLGGLGPATLDTDDVIGPGEARRMACAAGVVPAVLGTDSQVLDLGRTARLFSPAQRKAMSVRQHHRCGAEGCDRPTAWADAHHLDGWALGGRTDLDRGVLVCPRHHTLAHHPQHQVEELTGGGIRITRRPRDTPRRR